MSLFEAVLLVVGGTVAGIINTMAGGGSMLTVPLLVLAGVPGNAANATNRVGILTSSFTAFATFRQLGVDGLQHAAPTILPAMAGSVTGALAISQVTNDTFERGFGLLMLPLIVLTIWRPRPRVEGPTWSLTTTMAMFFAIGLYAGAVQAGFGLVALAALSRAGYDLVTANMIKVTINMCVTAMALVVFIINGYVRWGPALILAVGLSLGGWLGARIAVIGGERIIRIVMVVAAIGLAGRLLGIWG